jgi:bifunctional non-homologous end joining protein LigD
MRTEFPVELLTEIGREGAELLLKDDRFYLQKKQNGLRRQFEGFSDGRLLSYNRNREQPSKPGKSVSYPNEIAGAFAYLKYKTFLFDGELVGDVYYAFDLLQRNGVMLAAKSYRERFNELCMEIQSRIPSGGLVRVCPTFLTTKTKQAAIAEYWRDRAEGVVFKRIDAPYRPARAGQHFKFKFTKKASCIVTSVGRDGKATMDIAMADLEKCQIIPVGRCSLNGKDTPKPGEVVEVRYLYATEAMRLYQPVFLRKRTDQTPRDCDLQQLQFKEGIL